MADENIGSVSVQIVADYSQLASGLRTAQDQAKAAGSAIASSFTSAVSPASALTQATDRLRAAEAALSSESAKHLQTIQADNAAYGTAQISLQALNSELQQAQQAYAAATAAAQQNASANQQAAAGATQAAVALTEEGAAAQAASQGLNQASGAAQQVGAANAAVGSSAAAAGIPLFRLYALVNLVSRALGDLDKVRESEINLLHLSEATGIATQTLAQFEGMISRAGGDADKMSGLVLKLSQSIEQGERGVARMSDELQRLGVTSKDPIQAFFQIADTIHNTSDRTEALAAAARVLGASEVDLIGIMSQGSDVLHQYFDASKEFAEQRAKAVNDSVELTRVERELKEALDGVSLGALPVLTGAIKGLSVAFLLITLPVKLAVDAIVQGFAASTYAALSFGSVMQDLIGGNFKKAAEDAKQGIDAIKGAFHDAAASMEAESIDAYRAVDKLLNGVTPKADEGDKNKFQPPKAKKEKADHSAENELRKQYEDELSELKSDHQVTLEEEISFWQERLSTVQRLGTAYVDLRRQISRTVGELTQRKIKKNQDDEFQEFETQLKENTEKARESDSGPAQQKLAELQDKLKPENQGGLSDEQLQKIRAQIPEAQREADRETLKELQTFLSDADKLWKDALAKQGRVAQPDDIIKRAEAIKKAYADVPEVVKKANEAIDAADKKKAEQTLQVSKIGNANDLEAGQSEIAQRKVVIQEQYALQVSHTYQEQLAYQQQLNELEVQGLALKLAAADANVQAAKTEGDVVKIKQAEIAQAQAQRAIDLQAVESAAKIAELKQKNSFGGQVASGLNQDAESAVSRLSAGFADLATQTKNWGQQFKAILKDVEKSIVETFAKAALKQGLNALQNLGQKNQQGGGGGIVGAAAGAVTGVAAKIGIGAATGGVQAAAQTANTAALTADTAATVADTAATTALVAAEAGMLAALAIQEVGLGVNTAALVALTTAVIALTAVDAVAAIIPFAAGGDPPVGVPSLVGEEGPELFIPRGSGTIIPADKTKALLQQVPQQLKLSSNFANVNFNAPQVPAGTFTGGGSGSLGDTVNQSSSAIANNHNTGHVGDNNFNLYGERNPRETTRQIADFMKRQTGKYSPANS